MMRRCYRALGVSDPLIVQPQRPSSTSSPSHSEQPHSKNRALPSTPTATPCLLPVSQGRIAAVVTSFMLERQHREVHGSCKGTQGSQAESMAGIPPCSWSSSGTACQLVAKREHRLKQLTKLLSRILAPHGSKPVRCLQGAC